MEAEQETNETKDEMPAIKGINFADGIKRDLAYYENYNGTDFTISSMHGKSIDYFLQWALKNNRPLNRLVLHAFSFKDHEDYYFRVTNLIKFFKLPNLQLNELQLIFSFINNDNMVVWDLLGDALNGCRGLKKLVVKVSNYSDLRFIALCVKWLPCLEKFYFFTTAPFPSALTAGERELIWALYQNINRNIPKIYAYHENGKPYEDFINYARNAGNLCGKHAYGVANMTNGVFGIYGNTKSTDFRLAWNDGTSNFDDFFHWALYNNPPVNKLVIEQSDERDHGDYYFRVTNLIRFFQLPGLQLTELHMINSYIRSDNRVVWDVIEETLMKCYHLKKLVVKVYNNAHFGFFIWCLMCLPALEEFHITITAYFPDRVRGDEKQLISALKNNTKLRVCKVKARYQEGKPYPMFRDYFAAVDHLCKIGCAASYEEELVEMYLQK